MEAKPLQLSVIGAGRVGTALAKLLYAAGYTVVAVHSRSPASAAALADRVGAVVLQSVVAAAEAADLILITVPDDAISEVAAALASCDLRGRGVVHTSGALSASVLDPLRSAGALVGSLHPAYPFAARNTEVSLVGVTFAVEAKDEPLRSWLVDIVAALSGHVLDIPPGGKPIYHAALVLVSNYTVTLYALALRLLTGLGADKVVCQRALDALLTATTTNLSALGVPDALTGPIVRADCGTVAAHLDALGQVDIEAAQVYRLLAHLTLPLAAARGIDTGPLQRLLDGK